MSLGRTAWRFEARTLDFSRRFASVSAASVLPCEGAHLSAREGLLVQLQDRWNAYCRELVLQSRVGGVTTLSGQVIHFGASRTKIEAITALRATYKGSMKKSPYWEPKWFDAASAIDAATRLQLPNLLQIAGGLGASPSPLEELRAVRNFFAHRGEQSAQKLRSLLGISTESEAHDYICDRVLGGATRFELWCSQLIAMSRAAAS